MPLTLRRFTPPPTGHGSGQPLKINLLPHANFATLLCTAPRGGGIKRQWPLSVSVPCLTLSRERKVIDSKLKIGRKEAHDTADL